MENNLILTDVDDVLLRWGDSFESWVRKNQKFLNLTVPKRKLDSSFNIESWLDCSLEMTHWLISEFNNNREFFQDIPPYEDALKYVNQLRKEGFKFIAITACDKNTWTHDARRHNLNKHFPGVFEAIHCVGLANPKREVLSWYRPAWYIEDSTKHAIAAFEVGHKAFLITRTHNMQDNPRGVKRVVDWAEIYDCIRTPNCFEYNWIA